MESRNLFGLMVIGIVALAIGLGSAEPLDLKVDDLEDLNVYNFEVGDLQPTDAGEHTFVLKNVGSLAGYASMEIQNVADNGNGLGEPETDAGDASDGAGQGELDEQTKMKAWVDSDCNNAYGAGEDVIFERYASNLPTGVDLLDHTNGYVASDILLGHNEEKCIALNYVFENRAGTENNIAQGDSFGFDIAFDLHAETPTYTLTTNVNPSSSGTVSGGGTYDYGTAVSVAAYPATGYHFDHWSGDLGGSENPQNILMDGPKSVTANFAVNTYTITPSAGAGGTISPSSVQTVNYGGSQAFTVTANSGYTITDVVIDGTTHLGSQASPYTYTFTSVAMDHTISASFGSTFGVTATGSTSYPTTTGYIGGTSYWNNFNAGYVRAFPVTLPAGTVTSIGAYMIAAGGNFRVALYSAGSGKPANLLTQSASTYIGSGWQDVPVTPYYVTAGTYWLAIQTDVANAHYYVNALRSYYSKAYGAFDSTWSASSAQTNYYQYYMRVTYTNIEGYAKATKVTLSDNDAGITSVKFYSHAAGNARLAIYSNSGGAPSSKLWESGSTAMAAGWNTVAIASGTPTTVSLSSGTYWLAWQWDSTNSGPSYAAGAAGDGNYIIRAYSSFPATWSGTSTSEKWSMYGIYTLP